MVDVDAQTQLTHGCVVKEAAGVDTTQTIFFVTGCEESVTN